MSSVVHGFRRPQAKSWLLPAVVRLALSFPCTQSFYRQAAVQFEKLAIGQNTHFSHIIASSDVHQQIRFLNVGITKRRQLEKCLQTKLKLAKVSSLRLPASANQRPLEST